MGGENHFTCPLPHQRCSSHDISIPFQRLNAVKSQAYLCPRLRFPGVSLAEGQSQQQNKNKYGGESQFSSFILKPLRLKALVVKIPTAILVEMTPSKLNKKTHLTKSPSFTTSPTANSHTKELQTLPDSMAHAKKGPKFNNL